MTEQAAQPGFQDKVKDLFHRGMVNHVVAYKDDRKVVDLPLNLVLVAALLAIWLVFILWLIALLTGYNVQIVNTEAVSAGLEEAPPAFQDEPGTSMEAAPPKDPLD
jgi:hypothetical protein